jgi:hypothetical protein
MGFERAAGGHVVATRVVLVSCVKTKGKADAPARDLYTSPLFRGMRRYAERNTNAWYILSAKYGLLRPDEVVSYYEQTLKDLRKADRLAWAERVQQALLKLLPPGAEVVILAGNRYRENLVPYLEGHGFAVTVPMAGLGFGPRVRR